ncbi:DHHC palmitoyltransferase-domain-containing protein [Mortierella sp. GBAus27b]|nr:DHHC palmitoyltransferase-domain-containing protein [Mortierella sp. GBAus27b]
MESRPATAAKATPASTPPSPAPAARTRSNAGGTATAQVTTDGFKVHSSALATPARGSAQNMSAVAATQRAAALAADDANIDGTEASPDGSLMASCYFSLYNVFSCLFQPLMPFAFTLMMGYIYYVYTFRVCIDYILHVQRRSWQANLYLGGINLLSLLLFISYIRCLSRGPGSPSKPPRRKPPPPIPPTTTAYYPGPTQEQRSTQSPQESQNANKSRNGEREPLLGASTAEAAHGNGREYGGVRIDMGQPRGQDRAEQPLATLSITKRDGHLKWCEICQINKPDRCHHCSQCEMCVLRMDHHCPWIGGCVGYNNHKFFYLFIFYTSAVALWVVVTMAPLLVTMIHRCGWRRVWGRISQDEEPAFRCVSDKNWICMSVVALVLTVILGSFTWAHTVYILRNRTTIELMQQTRTSFLRVQYTSPNHGPLSASSVSPLWWGSGFHVVKAPLGEVLWDRNSCLENWKSIMGPSWWLWFLPYGNTPGDGLHFYYNDKIFKSVVTDVVGRDVGPRIHTGNGVPGTGRRISFGTPQGQGNTASAGAGVNARSDLRNIPEAPNGGGTTTAIAVPISGRRSEDSDDSISSLGRSMPTPRTSPRLRPEA